MVVSIEFFGMQRVVTRTSSVDMPITAETRVKDALEYIRHRYPDLNLDERTVIITVNQEMVSLDRILKASDIISFLPHISGG